MNCVICYSGAVEAIGGPAIGASPVPGVSGDPALIAAGGNPFLANEGKAGGWEPTGKKMCILVNEPLE